MNWSLRFLGVGAAHAVELGSSAAVLECAGKPMLLIDCGPDTLDRYQALYGELPRAIYLTHTHLDHVGGMERLFTRVWFDPARRGGVRVFAHAALVPWLQTRVADYPGVLAEGGVNFWEAFRLVPCSRGFWLDGWWFDVFATRHHRPGTSFGLALHGSFVFTGDTRPVPEMLAQYAAAGERVLHDCGLVGNPSHSGVDDLEREYDGGLRHQLVLYHYGSAADGEQLRARGYAIARAGEAIPLPTPPSPRQDAG
ncbi:MBL fold metallo-hydrolase [Frateuria terrea]|uniref:Ribonuclease BN, tRNA processing enzyme n=1 Tax=Frateuria terrea TaxID=529704 RepID=A0A1H6Z828_9GAMM|nr:MBL fold metallo-hydrolase [Frateuria terrea]SEJ48144.1 Ribonuclease BN, tRNA processing enzyme [Frateuria terrea]SFP46020.1 Ribonuclease BN, tRNA processing enzyme [Frateuria terrea]